MRKLILFLFAITMGWSAKAQLDVIVLGGLHSVDVGASDFNIKDPNSADSFRLALENASYGFHFGAGLRVNMRNFFIQPELVFNSNKANFKIKDYNQPGFVDSLRTEKYQYLDIPIMLGFKFSVIRLYGGPVAHIFIHNNSELTDIDGYHDKFKTATFGYQAGLGLDLSFIGIDIRHEGNFSKYGDHINFFGRQLPFDKKASRLIGTISLRF